MKILEHKHLIIRAEVSNPPTDEAWLHNWLNTLVEKIGMKVCRGPITAYVDMPGNEGLTGVVVIETSHIAIHVWDAVDPALVQLDVYTCSTLDKDIIFKELEQWNPTKVEYKYLDREFGLKEVK
jgi:S-adenosylmethionine/arginine decarboxylase-like enzyme|tara:strand:+ start:1577 stop:1948 length:372 start_codon:yes stop_codon:yes gene_type:complete